jgi:hypothetical protein
MQDKEELIGAMKSSKKELIKAMMSKEELIGAMKIKLIVLQCLVIC